MTTHSLPTNQSRKETWNLQQSDLRFSGDSDTSAKGAMAMLTKRLSIVALLAMVLAGCGPSADDGAENPGNSSTSTAATLPATTTRPPTTTTIMTTTQT